MLATRWGVPFADPEWKFELKWDGVRTLLYFDGEHLTLRSRAGNDATSRYPELQGFTAELPIVLDGEIVSLDKGGRPSFERLQQRMNLQSKALVAEAVGTVPITYVVFDVLHHGIGVVDLPLEVRLEQLGALALPGPIVRSEPIDEDPGVLWDFVRERGLEGIVAKRKGSVYRSGQRSPDWRKITAFRQLRAVVGGFTEGDGGRTGLFGALLLGIHADHGLRWVGAVGSGFSNSSLKTIKTALDEMARVDPPFVNAADIPGTNTWVEPQLVALVQYKEWTGSGKLRAPSFKGFTDDPAGSITWDVEGPEADA